MTDFFKSILDFINGIVHNYGWSVVIMTILFRLVLLPLDVKSKISQRKNADKMARIAPVMAEMKKKYAANPQKLQEKTAELYKKEKISPFSGCLPMLLQWPILIAFFAVFRTLAVEQSLHLMDLVKSGGVDAVQPFLRENGFLWIKNIWMPDIAYPLQFNLGFLGSQNIASTVIPTKEFLEPMAKGLKGVTFNPDLYSSVMQPVINIWKSAMNGFYILPILSVGTQLLFGKLMPAAANADPQQAKSGKTMMYVMSALFGYFCLISSAALAIYWVVSNVVMILVQLGVNEYLKRKKPAEEGEVTA